MNEADTCREYVLPLLRQAGWDDAPHSFTEQRTFTDGRIIPLGNRIKRGKQKRADYLLRYTRDLVLAVVEAKTDYKAPGDGMQQAKDYAQILGLRYAYATNGHGIIEFDFSTGLETPRADFPRPEELWARLRADQKLTDAQLDPVLAPYNLQAGKIPRYYQDLAIRRVVQAIAQGRQRLLLTMATGTGKTAVAFQICWKLWQSRWNRLGAYRRPKILFLADRSVLVRSEERRVG